MFSHGEGLEDDGAGGCLVILWCTTLSVNSERRRADFLWKLSSLGCFGDSSVGFGGGGATLSMMVTEDGGVGESLLHGMMWG